jgi:hypothetical protein
MGNKKKNSGMVMSSGYRLCGPRVTRRYLILVNMVIAVTDFLYIVIGPVSLAHGTIHKGVIFHSIHGKDVSVYMYERL